MFKMIKYIRNNRFIQVLLFLAVLAVAVFTVHRVIRVSQLNEQQAAYEQMAQEVLDNRVELSQPPEEPEYVPEQSLEEIGRASCRERV